MIQPIEKKNVADEVFEKMLNMIIEGDWKKGEMIPSENELREAFSVSRSTVRQAVQRLSALGIVRSRQGKGTYVEQVDTSFYLNLLIPSLMLSGGDSISILEFTKSIQVECVRIVSQCASDEEIARLSDYLEQMRFAFHGSKRSMQQHEECFEALRARETERAVRIMVEHYDMLLQRMKDWLEPEKA